MLVIKKTSDKGTLVSSFVRSIDCVQIQNTDQGLSFFVSFNGEEDFFKIDMVINVAIGYVDIKNVLIRIADKVVEELFHDHFRQTHFTTLDTTKLAKYFAEELKDVISYIRDCESDIKEEAADKDKPVTDYLIDELDGFKSSYEEASNSVIIDTK